MKWKRNGLLFEPGKYMLNGAPLEFAQSPQTLAFRDRLRVYFSTRSKDPVNGKYFSHIAFIDLDPSLERVMRLSDHTVIPLGELGTFDEHGIFPVNVLRHENKIMAYTCGWSRRVSVSVETGVGLAFSDDDGETFIKHGNGPVMSASLHEPMLVGDAFVQYLNGMFYMWYIYGTHWMPATGSEPPARVYKIAQATSPDGIEWKRDSKPLIADVLGDDECQALPTVLKLGDQYHMYFCYRYATDFRNNRHRGYRIGYAHSTDLVHWERDDAAGGMPLGESGWDSEMMCYPHIFAYNGKVHLLYNGNAFGRHGFGLATLQE